MADISPSLKARIADAAEDYFQALERDGYRPEGCNGDYCAEHLIKALGIIEQYAVSSGERRQFEQFDTREDADRAFAYHQGNNENWRRTGRELPLWARNPQIESRLVSRWVRAGGGDA